MVSAKEIYDIQMLLPEEQNVIFSLVKSFLSSKDNMNSAQSFLAEARNKHISENPMSMEEIDRIIHEAQ